MKLDCCREIKLSRDEYYELEKSIEIETLRYKLLKLDIYKGVSGYFIDSYGNRKSNVLTANFFAIISAMLNRSIISLQNYDGTFSGYDGNVIPLVQRHLYRNEAITCSFTSQLMSSPSLTDVSVSLKPDANYRTIVITSNAPINFQQVRTSMHHVNAVVQCLSAVGSSGTLFSSFIEFKKPFTNNLPRLLYNRRIGSFSQYHDIHGSLFVPRTSTPHLVAASEIVVDVSPMNKQSSLSEDDPYFENPLVLSTASVAHSYNNAPSLYSATASFSPSSRLYVNSFGLCQRMYDSSGVEKRIVWIKKNISPPREVTPSKPFLLTIRFYGL